MHTNRLKKLLSNLNDTDALKRRSAAESLAAGDERAVYPLIKALRDENFGVQDAAMRSLMEIRTESTVYMLLPLLREDSFLRNTALLILQEIGTIAVPLFRILMKDKDDDVRKFTLDLIYNIQYCDYPEDIIDMLVSDSNANVRASAARTLGMLQHRDAIPQLIHALKDEEWVCFSALEALTHFKDEKSVPPVIELLNSASETVRFAAIEALGKIASPTACDPLIGHLSTSYEIERKAVIKSLVQIGPIPAVPSIFDLLIEMLHDDDWDNIAVALKGLIILKEKKAIRAMVDVAGSFDSSIPENEERKTLIKEAIRSYGCSEPLISILGDSTMRYRGKTIAIEILGELKCLEAVNGLMKLLKSDLRDVRRSSIKSLAQINNDKSRECVREAISDPDSHVRRTAAAALGQMRDMAAFEPMMKMLKNEEYNDVIDEFVISLLNINASLLKSRVNEFNDFIKTRIKQHSSGYASEDSC
jgi:HEAT repeat protein